MAIVRRSLEDIRASRPHVDRARFEVAMDDARIAQAVVADPDLAPDMSEAPLSAEPRSIRLASKLTQEQFAALLKVPVATLRNWEQARHRPDPAAAALFRVMAKDLGHVLKLLRD
jgi:putative transcriptional regulator